MGVLQVIDFSGWVRRAAQLDTMSESMTYIYIQLEAGRLIQISAFQIL